MTAENRGSGSSDTPNPLATELQGMLATELMAAWRNGLRDGLASAEAMADALLISGRLSAEQEAVVTGLLGALVAAKESA